MCGKTLCFAVIRKAPAEHLQPFPRSLFLFRCLFCSPSAETLSAVLFRLLSSLSYSLIISRHIFIASDDEKRAFPVQFAVRLVCNSCNNSFAFDLLIISHSRDFVKSFFCQPRKGGSPTKGVILLCCCLFTPSPPRRCIAYLLSL